MCILGDLCLVELNMCLSVDARVSEVLQARACCRSFVEVFPVLFSVFHGTTSWCVGESFSNVSVPFWTE